MAATIRVAPAAGPVVPVPHGDQHGPLMSRPHVPDDVVDASGGDRIACVGPEPFDAAASACCTINTSTDRTEVRMARTTALMLQIVTGDPRPIGRQIVDGALDDARLLLQLVLGRDIVTERIATTSDADRAEWPLLADTEYGGLAAMLDDRKRFFRLSCPVQTADATPPRKRASATDRFRFTGDIDSLALPRGGPKKLRAVTQAEVSYTSNRLDDSETFHVTAYAGYDLARAPRRQFIPFVGFEREQTRQSGPDDNGTSRISAGFLYGAEFDSSDTISVAPLYVVDRIHDSRIASLRAAWTPGFLYRFDALSMGNARRMGPLLARMDLQLRAQAGRVIDAGDSTELADTDDYFRLGPALRLELWPTAEHGLLSRLSADAGYRRFFRMSGPEDVEWWGAGINYSIEPTDHVTIRYSYEQGEDEETLVKSRLWKLVLGVRF